MTKVHWGWMILVLVVATLVILFFWWTTSARGFSASASPTWIETKLAKLARSLAAPAAVAGVKDPLPVTEGNITMGAQHFAAHCAICHNNNGDGRTEIGRNLYPKAPDMRRGTQKMSDGEIFYTIRNGIRMSAMPAWPNDHDDDLWRLVQFIKQLPSQTPAQIAMMQQFNPKSIYPEPIM